MKLNPFPFWKWSLFLGPFGIFIHTVDNVIIGGTITFNDQGIVVQVFPLFVSINISCLKRKETQKEGLELS